jgi:hypothetical protein
MRHVYQETALLLSYLLLVTLLGGCAQTAEKPSVFEALERTTTLVTTAADTVTDAVMLGTLDVGSEEYAKLYHGINRAQYVVDQAWLAYRAGDNLKAEDLNRLALSTYGQIRPLLLRLAEGAQ